MMKLNTAHRLALFACLPAAAGAATASAGTVTLLSQERSVSVTVTGSDLFTPDGRNFSNFERQEVLAAEDFSLFDAATSLTVDADEVSEGAFFGGMDGSSNVSNPNARQRSSFEQRGDAVAFSFSGAAFPGAPGSFAAFEFAVTFSIDEATPFELTGTGLTTGNVSSPFFLAEDASRAFDLFSFQDDMDLEDLQPTFDFTAPAVSFQTGEVTPNTGVLEAGTYRFGVQADVDNPGFDSTFARFTDFGLILRDSTLAGSGDGGGGPVPIPSPAALPAGLALLGAGLMRRRRDAAA